MRGFWKRIEAAFAAVAFAEEGDAETARRVAAGDEEACRRAARPRLVRQDPDRPAPAREKVARLP